MHDETRAPDVSPRTLTSPRRVVASCWALAGFLLLYASADVHAWLAWEADSTSLERRLGRAILAAGETLRLAPARTAIESRLAVLREAPLLLARRPPGEPASGPASTATPVRETRPPAEGTPRMPDAPGIKRILLVGASSIEFHLGVEVERCLERLPGMEVHRVGKLGSGLARPQDFDWPPEIARLQERFRPDLVLAQLGGNDCRPAVDPGSRRRWTFGSETWAEEYGARVESLARNVQGRRARLGFLGQLAVRRPGNRRCFERIDEVTRTSAIRSGAAFIPLRRLTLGSANEVLETLVDESGVRRRIWLDDGVHVTRAGARHIARSVCRRVERRFSLDTGDPSLGRVHRMETASTARGRRVPWYAILPRSIPPEGVPALLLLHGGGGSLEDWMQAQEELQRLAVRHGTAIVVPDGDAWSWYADGIEAGTGIETHLVHELLPEAGRRLPLDGRWGVAGYSMGGHGALALALRNPGVFRSASSMSGVVDLLADPTRNGQERVFGRLPESLDRWKSHSARHLLDLRPDAFRGLELLVSCGTGDRFIGVNRRFHEALQATGIPHGYDEGPGRHDWDYWVGRLPSHVAWHAERLRTAPSPEGLPRE